MILECDHAWIFIERGGVCKVAWSDNEDWKERSVCPFYWQSALKLILKPKIIMGEILIIRGHLVRTKKVYNVLEKKDYKLRKGSSLTGYENSFEIYSKYLVDQLKEEIHIPSDNIVYVPPKRKTSWTSFRVVNAPQRWLVKDKDYLVISDEIEKTEILTADRYIVAKKEVFR